MRMCSIASGSSGNCIYVGSDNHHILIDAGISGKRVEAGLRELELSGKDIDGILLTHEHSDHIKGLGVLARKYGVPIYATPGTAGAVKAMSGLGRIDDSLFVEIHADQDFQIGDLKVSPFHISHDAAEPVAYRIACGEKKMAVATDLGVYTDYTVEHLKGLDVLLLEANHDIHMLQVGAYPYYLKQRISGDLGHLSNETAGKLLCEVLHDDLKAIVLGHLSKENNYAELAYETVKLEITLGDTPYQPGDFPLSVASRDERSACIAI
ncbi:ribonuclease Z [Lachnoclostridium sp. An131]|jgi:phosphoribosyl 1,2-cyclic phosphodiesterase|uniref:MBL fold metallo-hydrolase n=1 Tax=Lachnoclostridium sp. An131 TaxID=1965555 RepID=UPI000B38D4F4|nr:MBL fold metallo-hydrolase [Lachnoclostridium sp. An131]OUQ27062.1 ribonuclease Z [Lachnoclostridium sp. An131]